MMPIYRHSGKTPLAGLTLATLAGLATAIVLGVAYSYAIVYCPIVYLNALLTFLYGCAIGVVVSWAAKTGHVRSRLMPSVIGVTCALIGLYVAWGTDRIARFGIPPGGVTIPFELDELRGYIEFFYANGFWAIGHGGANNNANVSGIFLAVVWFAEAVTILGGAAFVPWQRLSGLVYCEPCERWAQTAKGVQRLSFGVDDAIIGHIAAGDLSPLDTWPRAKPGDQFFYRLNLDTCTNCTNSNYLSIERVITQLDKKGKPQQVVTPVITRLAVDPADVPRVHEAGHAAVVPVAVEPPEPATGDLPPLPLE
jgi:hypothetical protein